MGRVSRTEECEGQVMPVSTRNKTKGGALQLAHGQRLNNGSVLYDSYRNPQDWLLKNLGIVKKEYQTGWWGSLHPPVVDGNEVVVEAGVGYRSNKHFHAQNFAILSADENCILLQVRKNADQYPADIRHYFIIRGIDKPEIQRVPRRIRALLGLEEGRR